GGWPSVRSHGGHSCSRGWTPNIAVMDNVSRPLIALLVGSVAFFAVWMVALKPSSSPSGSSGGGSSANHSAVAKAHQAVATSNGASVAHGGVIAGTGPATAPAVVAHPAVKAAIPV